MIFTDAHTSSSVCTPTRYGILTGRYNWRSPLKSVVLNGFGKALIPDERTTVASIMKSKGYTTAMIGKSHLGWNWALKKGKNEGYWLNEKSKVKEKNIDFSKPITHSPNDIGFDYHFGNVASTDFPPYVYVEQRMPTSSITKPTVNKGNYVWWRKGLTADDFVHEEVLPNYITRSIQYIKKRNKEKDKPFFLYIPLPSPHTPIFPTDKWKDKSGLNLYGDFVMMIDYEVGRLLKAVKEQGIEKNTLVIFTSDNGCSPEAKYNVLKKKGHNPSAQFRGRKADIFEGGHRVPFIVKWSKEIEAGTSNSTTICTTDLMATLAEMVGYSLKDNEGEDSFSMLPLFKQKNEDFKRKYTVHHSVYGNFAIRKGDWKLIFTGTSGGWSKPKGSMKKANHGKKSKEKPFFQLYNLKEDIGETKNLLKKYPKIVSELRDLMIKCLLDGRSTPGTIQKNDGGNPITWQGVNFLR